MFEGGLEGSSRLGSAGDQEAQLGMEGLTWESVRNTRRRGHRQSEKVERWWEALKQEEDLELGRM